MIRRALLPILASFILAFTSLGGPAQTVAAQSAPGQQRVRVFIGFTRTPGAQEQALVRAAGGQIRHSYNIVPAISAELPEAALNGLRANPNVRYIEPVIEVTADDLTSELDNTWGVKQIGSDGAWSKGATGATIKVAVLDSGVDYLHTDLAGQIDLVNSHDFVNDDSDPMDDNGHGTHVSGTIAAVQQGAGVVGVAPQVRIIALKVLNAQGSGSFDDIIAALQWAKDKGANVTNQSLGSSQDPGVTVSSAYASAEAAGILNVASAGNSGNCAGKGNSVGYPARYPSVLAVAATDSSNKRACFSSSGPAVGISAPGVSINSTVPAIVSSTGYALFSGTSMASPHVAGVAALVFGTNAVQDQNGNGRKNDEVRAILTSTALDLGATGRDDQYGAGLVQAAVAVTAAIGGSSGGGGGGGTGTSGIATVGDVAYSRNGGKGGQKNLAIAVKILGDGATLAGATVSVSVTRDGALVGTGTGTTNTSGVATFNVTNAPAGCYGTTVTNVAATGFSYTPTGTVYTSCQ